MGHHSRPWWQALGICGAIAWSNLVPLHASAGSASLTGSGSTFDAPFFAAAFPAYAKSTGVSVQYAAVGSAAGVTAFIGNKVDFGASDVPMSPIEGYVASANGGKFVQIPVALGGIAVAYNLPQVGGNTLQIDGQTLARIFLGQIANWNDPAIAKLNPTVNLPAAPIQVVHRLDRSGTTAAFTAYLGQVSAKWASTVGVGKSVAWPTGSYVSGGKGMTAAIGATAGSIGYVDLSAALASKLSYMSVKNAAGNFELPTEASVAAAAAQTHNVSPTNYSIANAAGQSSYPIATYSWALIRTRHANAAQGAAIANLFRWLVGPGQSLAATVNYVALPSFVQTQDAQILSSIR